MTAYLKSSSVSLPSSSFLDKVAIHLTQIITDTLSDGDDDEHSSSEREMEMETGPSMVSPTPTSGPWPPSVLLKILNHLNARGVSRKPFEIHTKRLVLRAARMDDVDCFHEIMKDRETMRYWWVFRVSACGDRDPGRLPLNLDTQVNQAPCRYKSDGRVGEEYGIWMV